MDTPKELEFDAKHLTDDEFLFWIADGSEKSDAEADRIMAHLFNCLLCFDTLALLCEYLRNSSGEERKRKAVEWIRLYAKSRDN